MLGQSGLAFVAGLVTILNPCVLPLIPIVVATTAGKSRLGPLALALGLALSFASFGFLIVAFGFQLGINERVVRTLAGGLLLASGIVLLTPPLQARLSALASPATNRVAQLLPHVTGSGVTGQFVVGLLLGLVWAPCVGPTLGAAIAAASQGEDLASAFLAFSAFGAGVALAIVGFAYGSRKALGGRAKALQQLSRFAKPLFGIALIVVGLLVVTGLDHQVEALGLAIMPDWLVTWTTRF
ncbi:MAG: cytochrome c biogenesis protein CcdA [Betaproteobacteria bacterium]|nr:cytochrome c biogenesis protein CcdA [Betaproteobacteria bacterium]